jgi:cation channel sperm-associated protein 2
VLIVIFFLEFVLKTIAFDKHYFKDNWNRFDLSVVILTFATLIAESLNASKIGRATSILRSMRILKVLRLVKRFKRLQIIFKTMLGAGPTMVSLGFLLMLLIFIYSILGMQLFSFTKISGLQSPLYYHVNFQKFKNAFLLLI